MHTVDPTTTIRFGRPSLPSPPAELLTSAQYQRDYLQKRAAAAEAAAKKKESAWVPIQHTNASLGSPLALKRVIGLLGLFVLLGFSGISLAIRAIYTIRALSLIS
jgi:hypothetical protein